FTESGGRRTGGGALPRAAGAGLGMYDDGDALAGGRRRRAAARAGRSAAGGAGGGDLVGDECARRVQVRSVAVRAEGVGADRVGDAVAAGGVWVGTGATICGLAARWRQTSGRAGDDGVVLADGGDVLRRG